MTISRGHGQHRHFEIRAAIYQVLVVGGFVWLIYFLATNTAQNLELRGMLTGFGFLNVTAGFDVDFTLIGYRLGVDTMAGSSS